MSEDYWIQKEVLPKEEFPGPTPADLKGPEEDYILGPGDLIDISVYELMAPGQPYATRVRISQTGQISFPYLGTIKAAGLTTRGLEEKLSAALEKEYIKNPQVSVFVFEFRNLNVSVINGLARPGLYPLQKLDQNLIELVAMAGGIVAMTEDYGYIIRKYSPDETLILEAGMPPESGAPAKGSEKGAAEGEKPVEKGSPEATPKAEAKPAATATAPAEKGSAESSPKPEVKPAATATAPAAKPAPVADKGVRDLLEKMAEGEMPAVVKIDAAEAAAEKKTPAASPTPAAENPGVAAALAKDEKEFSNWIWSDGKWIQVKTPASAEEGVAKAPPAEAPKAGTAVGEGEVEGAGATETPAVVAVVAETPETERLKLQAKLQRLGVIQGAGQLRRIIRFDVQALQAGDPTQNIVLRDGDIVTIPSPPLGDFYMSGQVARPGVYSLTGRKITLLEAVVAAGDLTAVAVPWRTEVVRRLSETEEEIIYVDLAKIARGEVPDFYLHPDDIVRVGTDEGAIFNAVLRNAFRATYGFGSVYDMNFADFYPWSNAAHAIFHSTGAAPGSF